jgi:hypothetical protein
MSPVFEPRCGHSIHQKAKKKGDRKGAKRGIHISGWKRLGGPKGQIGWFSIKLVISKRKSLITLRKEIPKGGNSVGTIAENFPAISDQYLAKKGSYIYYLISCSGTTGGGEGSIYTQQSTRWIAPLFGTSVA